MTRYRFEIDLWSSDGTFYSYAPRVDELYNKWKESGLDSDFEVLAEWAADEIAGELDFCVVNIEKEGE